MAWVDKRVVAWERIDVAVEEALLRVGGRARRVVQSMIDLAVFGGISPGAGGGVIGSAEKAQIVAVRTRLPVDETYPTATNWPPRPEGYGAVISIGADPAPADKTPFDLHFTVGDLVPSETTTFSGSDGDPWPAPWVAERVPATGGAVRIASGEGELVTGATGSYSTLDTVAVRYGDHNSADSSWTFTWRIVGASSYPRVVARSDAANLDPSEAVLVGWSTTSIDVVSVVAGTFVTTATTAKTHSLDTEYGARIVFAGSTVRARTWLATGPEPDTWDVEAQVANVGAGYMGVSVGGANSATNRTFRIDDLAVVTGTDMSTGGGYGSDYGQNYGG